MLSSLFFFFSCCCFWFLLLSCDSFHIPSRRILHQPFVPLDSISPSEPPSPPSPPTPPKYPFSSSAPTPPDSPFFPSFPSAPPPPSPATFASFPANISSLILPHTPSPKHNSPKLLILAIAAVISASVVAGTLVFFYCRRRRQKRNFVDDNKTFTSDNSSRLYPNNNNNSSNNVDARKQRTTSTTSSEFLYLGTLVNSGVGIDEDSNNSGGNALLDPRKMESPELQPLPPLSRQNTGRNFRDGEVESVTEEEEEFYSPRGSLGGRESSSGTGSGSRRVFTAIAVQSIESSRTCSCSSSSSGSPARSQSRSISPPISLSPGRSDPKSPELVQFQPSLSPERILADTPRVSNASSKNARSPSLSLTSTSPDRVLVKESDDRSMRSPSLSPMAVENPDSSAVTDRKMGSPLLSSAATSPNRLLIEKLDESIRNFNDLVQNMKTPLIVSSAATSSPAKESSVNDLDRNKTMSPSVCSASTSPERNVVTNPSEFPRMLNDADRIVRSPSLSSASASPDRALNENERSPLPSSVSSSPDRAFEKSPDMSPLKIGVPDSVKFSSASAAPDRALNENEQSPLLSSASSSPDTAFEKSPDMSPLMIGVPDSGKCSPASTSPDRALNENKRSPLLSSASSSPDRAFEKSPDVSPLMIDVPDSRKGSSASASPDKTLNENERSPLLSSASSSPDRAFEKSPDMSPSMIGVSDSVKCSSATASPDRALNENERPPLISSASSSPNRAFEKSPDISPLMTGVSDSVKGSSASASPDRALNENERSPLISSASSSPDRAFEKSPDISPLMVVVSDSDKGSSLSSSASSSPVRDLEKNPDASPVRINRALEKSILTPPPQSPPKQRRLWEKPVPSISTALEKSILTPPPPPLPPPPPKQRRLWEKPVSSLSFAQQISKPPPLMPPSMPFMTQNPTKISPVELSTRTESEAVEELEEEASKPKLKPLHWDKVRASSDREMVWDHLRSSSFKLNEEMIETLFVVNAPNSKPKQTTPRSVLPSPNQENRVLDPKKAQNIAILLRALNVTVEEVCEALLEGNADTLNTELLECLLKMAPTKEEERRLKEYKDDSLVKLGPAETFLKAVLDIPFAFQRVDAMLYTANFESEVEYLKRSFETLEAACEELRNSRMFLKLLEAVLKTGNRMNVGTNRGDAHAFKLDTLLKLVDVKGADGKTTLLHFVVQEIIRTEGARLSDTNQTSSSTLNEDARCRKLGLQVVSGLSSELANVKKAAAMDSEVLSGDVSKLSKGVGNIGEVLRLNETMGSDESREKFSESMNRFMKMAEEEIFRIQAHESVALSLVKEITEYFHGDSAKEEAHPFRIFMVVRDFLTVLDRVCKEVGMINERTIFSSAHKFPVPVNPMMQPVFPVPVNPTLPQAFSGFQGRLQYDSDDETASP